MNTPERNAAYKQALDNLCNKDTRYTNYAQLYDAEYHPTPRVDCFCDNCHNGRDDLAVTILKLLG